MKRSFIKLYIFAAILIVLGGGLYAAYSYFNAPPDKATHNSLFIVRKGESVRSVAHRLEKDGYIHSDRFFYFLAKITGNAPHIKSGEYRIFKTMNTTDILHTFVAGNVVSERFTIPEGFTMKQIADLLESKGLTSKDDFLKACMNSVLLKKYHIPFKTAEGFLFPETYRIARGLNAQSIAEMMIQRFFYELRSITTKKLSPEELKRVVIIASIVEKEAKIDQERPLISAVFYNRLKKGKRLESCATVQYALGKSKERLLYRDLKVKSPYNTYLHKGLPPGPIANPGKKSLVAALNPAPVNFLFFVSKHDGSHYFSSTYEEHLRAFKLFKAYNRVGPQS